tara:strand:+ start:4226 stop:5146 length:921 start_codon:yes stop_codon:yes gene_type:complete
MMNNRDRLAEARAAFEQLKAEFQSTGRKVNISAVAERAKIDRKYLYGKLNTPDKGLIQRWVELGEEITSFRKAQKDPSQDTGEVPVATKLHNALVENYSLLENVRDLEHIRERLQLLLTASQRKVDELESRTRMLESNALRQEGVAPVVVNMKTRPQLISPDAERHGSDQLSLKKAWVEALNQLRSALARPVEKTLFVTVGAPGSGKSTWGMNFIGSKGYSIVFDACNLTQSDRYELLDIARQHQKTKVVAVVFYADLTTLESRNTAREDARKVPVSKLRAMYRSIEYPTLADSIERFDEIMMLRS